MVTESPPAELMIGWNSGQQAVVSKLLGEIDHTLGQPTAANEVAAANGEVFRQRSWPFYVDKLPAVAAWFDDLEDLLKTKDVVARSSTFRMFVWRDEPPPFRPTESTGGGLGIHFGRPHRLTTIFSFRSLEQYKGIKDALSKLGLAELSDKHLRPKVRAAKR